MKPFIDIEYVLKKNKNNDSKHFEEKKLPLIPISARKMLFPSA
jgi:hypothetical protein